MSTQTASVKIVWSSPQTGIIAWGSTKPSQGSAGTFNFPSGYQYQYFQNSQTWEANIPSGNYLLVLLYNWNSNSPPSLNLYINGQEVSVSGILQRGTCGVEFELSTSINNNVITVTCVSFDNTAQGSTILHTGCACTCCGVTKCNGCPNASGTAWGFYTNDPLTATTTSSVTISNNASYITKPSTTTQQAILSNNASYIQQVQAKQATLSNNAFIVQRPSTTTTVTLSNNAFYIQSVQTTQQVTLSNDAFYIQPKTTTTTTTLSNNAFYIQSIQTTQISGAIGYAKFLSIPQANYFVIEDNITISSTISQPQAIVIGIKLSPTITYSITQTTVTQPQQTYEQIFFEELMTIPILYEIFKFIRRLIRDYRERRHDTNSGTNS